MSIRSRVEGVGPFAVIASQTGLVVGAFRMPAKGRIKSVRQHSLTVAGTVSVSVLRSATMLADDTSANSTTLVHDAALVVTTSDTPSADPMTAPYIVEKGVWLYIKYTSAGASTTTATTVLIEIDY